jgi:short-subunit dehydrogenase
LRGELRSSGVRVVTLCPGYVDTPLTRGNRYFMPFLMPVGRFADKAWRAIEDGVSYTVIPWQMGIVAKLLRVLPNRVFDALFAGRLRKRRVDDA